jgi:predicted TIM-barrel fold metal-dependent hydrolase
MYYSSPQSTLITADELIDQMDENEVNTSVILNIGWRSHDLCVMTNDYLLETAERYNRRLVPFCSIQPSAGDIAVGELLRCLRAGARGLGEMRPDVQDFSLTDDEVMNVLVQDMVDRKAIFLVHSSEPVGHEYSGKGEITPQRLYSFISKYPELNIVCAHWGGGIPFYALMPEVATAMKNVYVDTAATVLLYDPRIYKAVIDIIGSNKILFGSDFPLINPTRIINQINSSGLSDKEKKAILGSNAWALLYE